MERVPKAFVVAVKALLLLAPAFANAAQADNGTDCKCIPGDACWPAASEWAQLNQTVGGKLISNKPLAHVCHDPDYDEAACDALKQEWVWPIVHQDAPAAMMVPYFQNCTPYTPQEQPCPLGTDAVYSINVTSGNDIAAGVKFANKHNVRLVVRSTGHDFLGKSTGTGSLGLWTHNMKDISIIDSYTSSEYTGPAMKLAAGVRGTDALSAAHPHGLTILTGNCPSVGLVGGWSQGGGHSSLSTVHGMGVDQILEWEVVTAAGELVTASPTHNTDLYWALSGGGPGTYGIAVSVTVRVFQDTVVGGASLAFAPSAAVSNDTYWKGIEAWLAAVPGIVAAGGHAGFSFTNAGFRVLPVTLAGASKDRVREVIEPFTTALQNLSIPFQLNVTSLPSFYDHYTLYLGPIPRGNMNINVLMGGRLIPRTVLEADGGKALADTFRTLLQKDTPEVVFAGVALSTNASGAIAPNALLPQWRTSLISVLSVIPWDFTAPRETNEELERQLNEVVVPRLTELTPGSGTYLNEANFANPTWKQDYYGVNYDHLRQIKSTWDPTDLFYGPTMVGSDAWVERDGRLCRP